MVKEIKRKPLKKRFQSIALSPFTLPILLFLFVILTLPVIYLVSRHEQDIRQQAASIATNSIVINTEDVSYQQASNEILTVNSITVSGLTIALIAVVIFAIVVIFYRRKVASY